MREEWNIFVLPNLISVPSQCRLEVLVNAKCIRRSLRLSTKSPLEHVQLAMSIHQLRIRSHFASVSFYFKHFDKSGKLRTHRLKVQARQGVMDTAIESTLSHQTLKDGYNSAYVRRMLHSDSRKRLNI
jgi:hypothetical protein